MMVPSGFFYAIVPTCLYIIHIYSIYYKNMEPSKLIPDIMPKLLSTIQNTLNKMQGFLIPQQTPSAENALER